MPDGCTMSTSSCATSGCDHARERVEHVAVRDARADVHVADLHERAAGKPRRQSAHRQRAADDLEPVRLDPPRVEADRRRSARRGDAEKPAAAGHCRRQEPIFFSALSLSRKLTPFVIHGAAGSPFR